MSIREMFNVVIEKTNNASEWCNDNIFSYVNDFWARIAKYKVFVLCSFIWAGMRSASAIAVSVFNRFHDFGSTVGNAVSSVSGGGLVGSTLEKVNVILPVSELFVLIAALGGLWLSCLGLRWVLSVWHAIPFKAT